jgi:uncharacterized protein YeaO (DUF488 family)
MADMAPTLKANILMKKPIIRVKRVYEKPLKEDGLRVLVDRLWPRGLTKEAASVEEWTRDLAPSTPLRKWFGHDPQLWPEFRKRYRTELDENDAVEEFISSHTDNSTITLVHAARDEAHNHAIILREYLNARFHAY